MSINFSKYPNQIAGLRKSGSHYVSGGEERLVKLWDYVTWWLKATGAGKKTPMDNGHPNEKTKASNIGMEQKTKASKGWAKICEVFFCSSSCSLGYQKNPFDDGGGED